MQDLSSARKVHLNVATVPSQKQLANELLQDISRFEAIWKKLNQAPDNEGKVQKRSIAKTLREAHDSIGAFRQNIDTARGAVRGNIKKQRWDDDGTRSKASSK